MHNNLSKQLSNDVGLKSGDIIFISIPNFLYQQIEKGTGCRASHVGMLFYDDEQGWLVAESKVPLSTYTTLEKYLLRTKGGWCCVRRLNRALSESEVIRLREECDKQMGKLYHFGFKYFSPRLFCSKFVYDAYKRALNIEVGELNTFKELFEKQPGMSIRFWRFWFFGFIPWKRITVTPASQLDADNLESVYLSEK